jgi:hypothetical protein
MKTAWISTGTSGSRPSTPPKTRTAVRALGETPPDFGPGVFVFLHQTPCTALISRLNSN